MSNIYGCDRATTVKVITLCATFATFVSCDPVPDFESVLAGDVGMSGLKQGYVAVKRLLCCTSKFVVRLSH